jgi:hypothetical protein
MRAATARRCRSVEVRLATELERPKLRLHVRRPALHGFRCVGVNSRDALAVPHNQVRNFREGGALATALDNASPYVKKTQSPVIVFWMIVTRRLRAAPARN